MYTEKYVSPLLQDTRNLIRARPPEWTYERIARETGLSVFWIQSFMSRTPNPGVKQTEYLYNFMRNVVHADH